MKLPESHEVNRIWQKYPVKELEDIVKEIMDSF